MSQEPPTSVPVAKAKRKGNYVFADHTGKKFGRLTVLLRIPRRYKGTQTTYECLCDCGAKTEVRSCALTAGATISCGCAQREATSKARTTHGASSKRTYAIWQAMKTRCSNSNQPHWDYYGGRGIKVCPQWAYSFEQFLADMGEAPPNQSIDRVDPDGNYEPANCRWATLLQQGENRRSNIQLTHNGETLHVAEWARRKGWSRGTISSRIRYGWSVHEILETPVRPRGW